ncbi:hypothetical protein HDU87_002202, partial [Geranomyces variabilis]
MAEAQRASAEAQRAAAAAHRAAIEAQRHQQQMPGGAGGSWFPAAASGGAPNSTFGGFPNSIFDRFPNSIFYGNPHPAFDTPFFKGYPGNTGSASRPPPAVQPGFFDTLFGVAPGTIPAFGGFAGGPSDSNTTYTTSYSSNHQQSNAPQQQQAPSQQQQYQQRQPAPTPQQQQRAVPQQNQNQQQRQQPRPAQPRPLYAQGPPPTSSSSSSASTSALAPPTLATLVASSTDPATLPTRTLKSILTDNKVDHSNVIEKGELVARVTRLVVAARAEHAAQERANVRFEARASPNRPVSGRRAAAATATENAGGTDDDDGICKICCDKIVNCVFLECGHLVT